MLQYKIVINNELWDQSFWYRMSIYPVHGIDNMEFVL